MISRRVFLAVAAGAPLAGCQTARQNVAAGRRRHGGWYVGQMEDQPHPIPLVDRSKIKAEYARQTVDYDGGQAPGTIVVDIDQRMLYLARAAARRSATASASASRVFLARTARVGRKAVWPDWTPTATMVSLKPDLPRHRKGGLDNPLGARALYLYQGNRDILFRIHGTNEPWSIGEQVSSGCIRMLNEDIFDLYNRVPVGSTVLVRRNGRWRV
jgi:lipoprotein-anchoring transpeptidase ErfK/SrfK